MTDIDTPPPAAAASDPADPAVAALNIAMGALLERYGPDALVAAVARHVDVVDRLAALTPVTQEPADGSAWAAQLCVSVAPDGTSTGSYVDGVTGEAGTCGHTHHQPAVAFRCVVASWRGHPHAVAR